MKLWFRVRALITGIFIVCTSSLAFATTPNNYAEGLNAFKQGDYSHAVTLFQNALNDAPENFLIHYNLGSALYKLERYQDSIAHFTQATKVPQLTGIAHYNLGLAYARLNKLSSSKKYFSLATQAEDENIQKLAKRQLNKFNQTTTSHPKKSSPNGKFSGFIRTAYHYDDNIANANEDLPTETVESDGYYDIFGVLNYKYKLSHTTSNTLKLGTYISRYDEYSNYDQTQFNIGFYHHRLLANWRTRFGVHAYQYTLDDTDYQQRINYQIRGDLNYAQTQRLRLQYDFTNLDERDPQYDYLSGNRHRLKIENRSKLSKKTSLTLGYRYENNARDDYSTASSFTSYSPIRHNVYAKISAKFSPLWRLRLELDHRTSQYKDDNRKSSVNIGTREDDRSKLTLRLNRKINKTIQLESKYRYTDNNSNDESKSYQSNTFSIGVNFLFF